MAAEDVFGIVGTTQAGNFHVERAVAEGGFGVVYRAQHGAFRAPVAIKCLKIPEQMSKQQRAVFLEKFREEAELMFRLSAAITEVVRPLHVDVLLLPDGRFVPFLALEWLEGESLDGIITRRREQGQAPLGLHKVMKMMRPVASALARAHRFPGPQGAVSIIHRDLKPENIFVANIGGTESMKILDFGIAKAKRAASQAAGRITGRALEEDETASFTPAYGAPEQWTPKTYGETGPWTDVWGLALTMVEVLCGGPVLDGDAYVMRRACLDEKRRPTPRAHGADVPIEVEKVFEKALAVDPRRRFKEVEAFWSELEVAMGLEPSLRTRDRRRDPTSPVVDRDPVPSSARPAVPAPAAPPPPAPALSGGARLARIDLQRVAVPAQPVAPKPRPLPRAEEDFSGIEGPASSRRQPALRASEEPATPLSSRRNLPEPSISQMGSQPGPESVPASSRPRREPVRLLSGELELNLPTYDAAPPPASLEEDLDEGAPAVLGSLTEPPRSQRRRALEAQLEMSLPITDFPPEPARRQAPLPSMSGEFELPVHDFAPPPASALGAIPTTPTSASAAVPDSGPRTPSPVSREAPREAPREDPVALDFELGVPEVKRPALSSSSSLSSGVATTPGGMKAPARLDFDVSADPRGYDQGPGTLAPNLARRRAAAAVSLADRVRAPVRTLLASLAVALADIGYQKATGNPLALGPVRPFWIAAPLALFGVGFLLWRLMGAHEDD